MPDEFDVAVGKIAAERNKAALPLTFEEAATLEANERSDGQLRASLPQITGGFATVEETMLRAGTLVGQLAKALMLFHRPDAQTIDLERARTARAIGEEACRLRLADLAQKPPSDVSIRDGLVCGGG
jgi:hypothetical protein